MNRLSNKSIAEQTATLTGAAVMVVGLLPTVPDAVFATGIVMTHVGIACSCFSSAREVGSELRLRYTIQSLFVSLALVAVVCWFVWGYTSSVTSFSLLIAAAASGYFAVYYLTRLCVGDRRSLISNDGNGGTEP